MVFTSVVRFIRSRGPDEFWRKRKVFKLASVNHFAFIPIIQNYIKLIK